MASYSIYGHANGQDNSPLMATVVLSDDELEVVSVTADDPEIQAEVESVIREYMEPEEGDPGMSARDAVLRYGGSYGEVKVTQ